MDSLPGVNMTADTQTARIGSTSSHGRTGSSATSLHRRLRRLPGKSVRPTALLLAAIALPYVCSAQADQAVARTDENSRTAHAQLVEKARRGGIDIYFE